MNYLQYKSCEMFSSTQLIRKSKNIFDKIESHEIEKAIILRDGKPSFIMLDFEIYEMIMNEYEKLKKLESDQENHLNELDINKFKEKEPEKGDFSNNLTNDINKENKDVKVEKLTLLDKLDSIEGIIINDTNEKPENLKEFWE